MEVLLRPTEEKKNYHLFCAPNGSRADAYGEDKTWDGGWTVKTRDAGGAVEYLVAVPFADIAENGMARHWLFNLGRNDRHGENPQCPGTSYSKNGDFRDDAFWASLDLPPEVHAKWARGAAAKKAAPEPVVLGRLDFYMREPEARWRIWDEEGRLEEVALDIRDMPCGTNAVTVRAHGRDWPVEVVKLPYWKGATQVNRFARCLERGGEKVLMAANCLVVRENPPREDGRFARLDAMKARGFRYAHVCTFSDKAGTDRTIAMLEYGRSIGMDFILWTGDRDGATETRAETRERLKDFDNIVSRVATDEPRTRRREHLRRRRCENEVFARVILSIRWENVPVKVVSKRAMNNRGEGSNGDRTPRRPKISLRQAVVESPFRKRRRVQRHFHASNVLDFYRRFHSPFLLMQTRESTRHKIDGARLLAIILRFLSRTRSERVEEKRPTLIFPKKFARLRNTKRKTATFYANVRYKTTSTPERSK